MGNEHGVFSVSVKDNIVIARLSACFNETGNKAYNIIEQYNDWLNDQNMIAIIIS